jgi:hypothetical protein
LPFLLPYLDNFAIIDLRGYPESSNARKATLIKGRCTEMKIELSLGFIFS